MTAIIRAYLPKGTNHEAIQYYMLGQGGYTKTNGEGSWVEDGAERLHIEEVVVYECVTMYGLSEAAEQIEHAGLIYLNDNRKEKAFLAVVIGDGVKSVYLKQENE